MKHDMVIDEKKFDRVSRRNRKKLTLLVLKTIYWYITKISYL